LKKALAYILLFVFLFNTTGYFFIFELHKLRVKNKIQSGTKTGSKGLTILQITDIEHNVDFQRVEKGEIRYKGSLYDVINEMQSGMTTIFYCIHDQKEENLLAAMKTVNNNKFLLSLWDHVIKIAIPHLEMVSSSPYSAEVIFPLISVSLHSVLLTKWSPPPERS
jgi:hypothetical protein